MTDFYQLYDHLSQNDKRTLLKVRSFMEDKVAPIINDYWIRDEFPFELIPKMPKDICDKDPLLTGLILMEMARIDANIATFYLVQNGLAIDTINTCGTVEQKEKYLDKLCNFDLIGCFALTEPDTGSGISKDIQTTFTTKGDEFILNGKKKWAGNAVFADMVIIWAKGYGFIVDTKTKGFKVEKIENKFGLKCVQNGLITLDNLVVPHENRLTGNYKDVLRTSRVLVGWLATGLQMGAYEHALKYAKERKQFGKPIASFQLIQDLLAKILGNVTACQCMMYQLSNIEFTDSQAALAKAFTTLRMRESVAWAREIFGGNGLSIDYNIGRFFTDAEAIYSYEGTYQIQNLIVGKHITGQSAFT